MYEKISNCNFALLLFYCFVTTHDWLSCGVLLVLLVHTNMAVALFPSQKRIWPNKRTVDNNSMNVTYFQAEYELSRGVSARDRLNQETEYAFFSPLYIYIWGEIKLHRCNI
jgi:hypothetical protein